MPIARLAGNDFQSHTNLDIGTITVANASLAAWRSTVRAMHYLQSAQPIANLPLTQINFEPESSRLTVQSSQDIIAQVLPALRSSRLYLKIDGSAAWPGPQGRFTKNDIDQLAKERAQSLAQFLSSQGIAPNRLVIGTIDAKFPNSVDEDELAQDRIVRFTLITVGGR